MNWREHPILKPPTEAEMARMSSDELVELHRLYHEAIQNAESDPHRYGFVLPNWKRTEELLRESNTVLALGGNKGAKTYLGGWAVVKYAMANPKSLIGCFSQTEKTSLLVQQPAVYHYLPAELKKKTLGQAEYISYSRQNGFASNSLILPNGSQIVFLTYSQYLNNSTILEGLDFGCMSPEGINLGVWLDEYLGGMELLDTLAFRCGQRNSKILITFTPIEGYTETVRHFLDGAQTVESREAELLNNRVVPYIQKCRGKDASVIYLHTKDNPFSGYDRVVRDAKEKGEEWVLCRVYGIPTRSISSKFPSFSREVNVVKHELVPKEKITRYMVLDPAGRKKWFMVWIAVDATDTWWVYREWPDVLIGDWAEWKHGKWAPGDGAKRDGVIEGVAQYVELMLGLEREDGEGAPDLGAVTDRLIDSRLGGSKYQGAHGVSTLIDDLADGGLSFAPAPGEKIEYGLQALQNKMAYDRTKPIDAANRPRLYVSERCENVIRAIQEYTGDGGEEEAWKDPIDCLRYAAVADICYIDPKMMVATTTGRGGY